MPSRRMLVEKTYINSGIINYRKIQCLNISVEAYIFREGYSSVLLRLVADFGTDPEIASAKF